MADGKKSWCDTARKMHTELMEKREIIVAKDRALAQRKADIEAKNAVIAEKDQHIKLLHKHMSLMTAINQGQGQVRSDI